MENLYLERKPQLGKPNSCAGVTRSSGGKVSAAVKMYTYIRYINHSLVSYFVGHHKDAFKVLGLIDCAGVNGCAHSLDRGHAHHLAIGLALFIGHQVETRQDQGMVVMQGISI